MVSDICRYTPVPGNLHWMCIEMAHCLKKPLFTNFFTLGFPGTLLHIFILIAVLMIPGAVSVGNLLTAILENLLIFLSQ